MKILILLIIISLGFIDSACSQTIRYFTPYFLTSSGFESKNKRVYTINDNSVFIEDYEGKKKIMEAEIFGIHLLDDADEILVNYKNIGYSSTLDEPLRHRTMYLKYFKNGKISHSMICNNNQALFIQAWDENGDMALNQGSGSLQYLDENQNERLFESYKDSVLIKKYGVRLETGDTIYYTFDLMASPKKGFEDFYKRLMSSLKYPRMARLAGKQGDVLIGFIIDEKGKLSDFKPLSIEGFRFEKKTIKKLTKFPAWNPAIYDNKKVSTRFVLPVKFNLY